MLLICFLGQMFGYIIENPIARSSSSLIFGYGHTKPKYKSLKILPSKVFVRQ